jgi:hypothetical protein
MEELFIEESHDNFFQLCKSYFHLRSNNKYQAPGVMVEIEHSGLSLFSVGS